MRQIINFLKWLLRAAMFYNVLVIILLSASWQERPGGPPDVREVLESSKRFVLHEMVDVRICKPDWWPHKGAEAAELLMPTCAKTTTPSGALNVYFVVDSTQWTDQKKVDVRMCFIRPDIVEGYLMPAELKYFFDRSTKQVTLESFTRGYEADGNLQILQSGWEYKLAKFARTPCQPMVGLQEYYLVWALWIAAEVAAGLLNRDKTRKVRGLGKLPSPAGN